MSADGHSITFNGVDLGGDSYGMYVVSRTRNRLPAPRVYIEALSHADGAVAQGNTFGPRYWTLECYVVATTEENRRTQMRAIVAALMTSQAGEKSLVFDDEPDRSYLARLTSGIDAEAMLLAETFTLEFCAPQPWAVATSETEENDNAVSGETTVNVTVDGTVQAPAVYLVKNGATEAASVALTNDTRSEAVIWANTLPADAWLEIDAENLTYRVSTDSGANWTTQNANVTGTPPWLTGGVSNAVRVTGITSGTLDIAYTARSL